MSDAKVIDAAMSWYMARTSFLRLLPTDPEIRSKLNDLANAEDNLCKAIRDGVKEAFAK